MEVALTKLKSDLTTAAPDKILLTPTERKLKQAFELLVATVESADDSTLIRISQLLRNEGLAVGETGIRHRKFTAAALAVATDPVRRFFEKL